MKNLAQNGMLKKKKKGGVVVHAKKLRRQRRLLANLRAASNGNLVQELMIINPSCLSPLRLNYICPNFCFC